MENATLSLFVYNKAGDVVHEYYVPINELHLNGKTKSCKV
jgi:hypothetical protein